MTSLPLLLVILKKKTLAFSQAYFFLCIPTSLWLEAHTFQVALGVRPRVLEEKSGVRTAEGLHDSGTAKIYSTNSSHLFKFLALYLSQKLISHRSLASFLVKIAIS